MSFRMLCKRSLKHAVMSVIFPSVVEFPVMS